MAVKTLSKSKYGSNYKISPNFTLSEMACKDGTDKVLYSTELLDKLEEIRAYGGFKVHINSGYRTPAYNKKIGGATASKHTQGHAADIVVYKDGGIVNARKICCMCQTLGFKGIGYISEAAVHVDMRPSGSYRGDERRGYGGNVSDFYNYFGIKSSTIEDLKINAPAEPKQEEKKEEKEESEMVYKTINDVPEWGKKAVQFRVDIGVTDGLELTDSMVRCWVVEDRENPFIANLEDVPEYWFNEVKEMLGTVIFGDGKNQIGMRTSELKPVIIAYRLKNMK